MLGSETHVFSAENHKKRLLWTALHGNNLPAKTTEQQLRIPYSLFCSTVRLIVVPTVVIGFVQ